MEVSSMLLLYVCFKSNIEIVLFFINSVYWRCSDVQGLLLSYGQRIRRLFGKELPLIAIFGVPLQVQKLMSLEYFLFHVL